MARGHTLARLGNSLYRLCRTLAILIAVYGGWKAFWASSNQLLVFAVFLGPAVLCWSVGKFLRFVLSHFEGAAGEPGPDEI